MSFRKKGNSRAFKERAYFCPRSANLLTFTLGISQAHTANNSVEGYSDEPRA